MSGHLKKKDGILGYGCNKSYININQNIIYTKYYLFIFYEVKRQELLHFQVFLDMKNVIKICYSSYW